MIKTKLLILVLSVFLLGCAPKYINVQKAPLNMSYPTKPIIKNVYFDVVEIDGILLIALTEEEYIKLFMNTNSTKQYSDLLIKIIDSYKEYYEKTSDEEK